MKNTILSIVTLILFSCIFSCCSSRISIDKLNHKLIAYQDLPDTVKGTYNFEVLHIDTFRRVFKCINCRNDTMIYHSIENVSDLMKSGFSYDFRINGKIYTLKANKGNPFIYYNQYFYYPEELNLDSSNYQEISYNKVLLR